MRSAAVSRIVAVLVPVAVAVAAVVEPVLASHNSIKTQPSLAGRQQLTRGIAWCTRAKSAKRLRKRGSLCYNRAAQCEAQLT